MKGLRKIVNSPSQIVGRDLNPAPIEFEAMLQRSLEQFKKKVIIVKFNLILICLCANLTVHNTNTKLAQVAKAKQEEDRNEIQIRQFI
jgi:hypothetical protein